MSRYRTRNSSAARYSKKRDANEGDIIKELYSIPGVTVAKLDRPCDLLVGYQGVTHLWEVKNPDGKDTTTDDQQRFLDGWTGSPLVIVRYPEEVRPLLGLASV